MTIKKRKGGYSVKYPGSRTKKVRTLSAAKRERKRQKAKY